MEMSLSSIAAEADVSVTYIYYLVTGVKQSSWKRSKQLGKITKTDPILWAEAKERFLEIQKAIGFKPKKRDGMK